MQARTQVLRDAVKRELLPLIAEMGFKRDRRSAEEKQVDRKPVTQFVRLRDGHFEAVKIQWDKYGFPAFIIEFWTDDAQRMFRAHGSDLPHLSRYQARIYPRRRGWWDYLLLEEPWYGRWGSISGTIKTARARLLEVDEFLRTGDPRTHF